MILFPAKSLPGLQYFYLNLINKYLLIVTNLLVAFHGTLWFQNRLRLALSGALAK